MACNVELESSLCNYNRVGQSQRQVKEQPALYTIQLKTPLLYSILLDHSLNSLGVVSLLYQVLELTASGQQHRWRPGHLVVAHDEDIVKISHRQKPMRNNENCSMVELFPSHVRLVQDEDRTRAR